MGEPVLLLVDYRGAFWSALSTMDTRCTMDVPALCAELGALGHEVEVRGYADLDLSRSDLAGRYVLYTSSEDEGAHYKRFIEAAIFGLRLAGAHPVPDPELLLAHHDKIMMETVRTARLGDSPGQPATRIFGTYQEIAAGTLQPLRWPMVLKPAWGAGSRGVRLVADRRECLRAARRLSRSLHLREGLLELLHRVLRAGYQPRSMHRKAMVLQELIPGLDGDYKVLRYGERFFVLRRRNRPGDFRASGSGLLDRTPWTHTDLAPLLDAALTWSTALGSPFCSLDVAFDPDRGIEPQLIEFQCVHFGPSTAEGSPCHFVHGDGRWRRVPGTSSIEEVFAAAVAAHIASGGHRRAGADPCTSR